MYHSPRIFYKLIPLPFLGVFFVFVIFTGIRCGVDIAQKPNKSGQILDQRWKIFFVIFTKLIPRRIFLYCKKFGVDGNDFEKDGEARDTTLSCYKLGQRLVQMWQLWQLELPAGMPLNPPHQALGTSRFHKQVS